MTNDRGFALAALMIFMMALSILMAVAVPAYRIQAQRELEEELIFRGQEYVRAIQKYQRRFGIYPPSIDALMETNGLRFLRRQYTDPISGESFRLLTINPDGSINGSTLYQQRVGNAPLFQGGTPQMFGQPGFGQGGPAQQQGGGGQSSQGGFGGAPAGAGGLSGFRGEAPGGGQGGSGSGGGFGQQPGFGATSPQGTFETGSVAGGFGQPRGVGTPGAVRTTRRRRRRPGPRAAGARWPAGFRWIPSTEPYRRRRVRAATGDGELWNSRGGARE